MGTREGATGGGAFYPTAAASLRVAAPQVEESAKH